DRLLPSTFTVINLGDAGVGSGLQGDLRYAINTANSNDDPSNRIVFQPDLAGTITLTHGPLAITKSLAIDGPGSDLLAVSGNHQSGVFEVPQDSPTQDLQISYLTVTDGVGVFYGSHYHGGGLFNWDDTVTLTRVTFSGNVVDDIFDSGGAVYNALGTMVLNS